MAIKGIRVKPMVPWPGPHGPIRGIQLSQQFPHLRGAIQDCMFVIGPPKSPKPQQWPCGTDVIWPVIRIEHLQGDVELNGRKFVCRHQIIAGD